MAQQAREEQARRANGTATVPVSSPAPIPAATAEVPRGELPIDQVLQYINGEAGSARKGKKKTQKKHK